MELSNREDAVTNLVLEPPNRRDPAVRALYMSATLTNIFTRPTPNNVVESEDKLPPVTDTSGNDIDFVHAARSPSPFEYTIGPHSKLPETSVTPEMDSFDEFHPESWFDLDSKAAGKSVDPMDNLMPGIRRNSVVLTSNRGAPPLHEMSIHPNLEAVKSPVSPGKDKLSPKSSTRRDEINYTTNSRIPFPSPFLESPSRPYSKTVRNPVSPAMDVLSPKHGSRRDEVDFNTNSGTPSPSSSVGTPIRPYSKPIRNPISLRMDISPGPSTRWDTFGSATSSQTPSPSNESPIRPYSRPIRTRPPTPGSPYLTPPALDPDYEKPPYRSGAGDYFSLVSPTVPGRTGAKLQNSPASTLEGAGLPDGSPRNTLLERPRTEYPFPLIDSKLTDSTNERIDDTQSPSPTRYPHNARSNYVQANLKGPQIVEAGFKKPFPESHPATQAAISRKRYPKLKGLGADPIAKLMDILSKRSVNESGAFNMFSKGSEAALSKNKSKRDAHSVANKDGSHSPKTLHETKSDNPATPILRKASTTLSSPSTVVLSRERGFDFEKSAKSSLSANYEPVSELSEVKQRLSLGLDNVSPFNNVIPSDDASNVTPVYPITDSSIRRLTISTHRLGMPVKAAASVGEAQVSPKISTLIRKSRWRSAFDFTVKRRIITTLAREGKAALEVIQKRGIPGSSSLGIMTEVSRNQSQAVESSPLKTSAKIPPFNASTWAKQPINDSLDMRPSSLTLRLHSDTGAFRKDSQGIPGSSQTNPKTIPFDSSIPSLRSDKTSSTSLPELCSSIDNVCSKRDSERLCSSLQEIGSFPHPLDRESTSERLDSSVTGPDGSEAGRYGSGARSKPNSETNIPSTTKKGSDLFLDGGFPTSLYQSEKRDASFRYSPGRHGSAIYMSSHWRRPFTPFPLDSPPCPPRNAEPRKSSSGDAKVSHVRLRKMEDLKSHTRKYGDSAGGNQIIDGVLFVPTQLSPIPEESEESSKSENP